MREMAVFVPGDTESHWQDRLGSLRPPFSCAKSRHVPRSLRVAVAGFVVVIIVIFFAFVFLFFFVLIFIWLLPKKDIGS
jgi:hypothetical protein